MSTGQKKKRGIPLGGFHVSNKEHVRWQIYIKEIDISKFQKKDTKKINPKKVFLEWKTTHALNNSVEGADCKTETIEVSAKGGTGSFPRDKQPTIDGYVRRSAGTVSGKKLLWMLLYADKKEGKKPVNLGQVSPYVYAHATAHARRCSRRV